jgi:short-subunit dehydrogenase
MSLHKVYMITGATSGIGEALTIALCQQDQIVIGIGRNQQQLDALTQQFPEHFIGYQADVALEQTWVSLVEKIKQQQLKMPDCLILNAGICEYIDQGAVSVDKVQRTFAVNFFANVMAAEHMMPLLSARENAQIAIVSSIASQLAMPRAEAYGASKAALDYFFDALMLNYPRVDYSLIHPGFVSTPLTAKNNFAMPGEISAVQAAAIIIKGLTKRKAYIRFPRWFGWLFGLMHRLPRSWQGYIGRKMLKQ